MRLLYLMTEPFGIGGVQSDLLTLSEDMTKRGHEVYVATTTGILLEEVKSKGARHVDIDFQFAGLRGLLRAALALRKAVREHAIELVAPQSVRSSIVAFVALRLMPFPYKVASTRRRVSLVTTVHNIHNPRHFSYVGHILQHCSDYVIFESNYERDRLLASGLSPDKCSVIHSGIDTDRFVPTEPEPELLERFGLKRGQHAVFGIVARLSEEKGHNYLVAAFENIYRKVPSARLLIVGDGPLMKEVRAQVEGLGLEDVVIFAGAQRNVPAFLALMDVFVLASTRESFPLAAREAMAAGKPVIAPRIGGCPEVVDDNVTGCLFTAANIEELATAMNTMLEVDRRQRFGVAARQRVERLFSRKSWVNGDERIYITALGSADGG
jgi:L-malate glycosyltransferase